MNYETATNDEIEIKLAELAGFKPSDVETYVSDIISEMANSQDPIVRQSVFGMKRSPHPSYCTDWNATMPLAVKYSVGVSKQSNELWMASNFDLSNPAYGIHTFHYDNNPLRAIVICLIKVLESKQ